MSSSLVVSWTGKKKGRRGSNIEDTPFVQGFPLRVCSCYHSFHWFGEPANPHRAPMVCKRIANYQI
jgi:hypothetical protein